MIDFDLIAWDDARGNVQHLAANGLTIEEVEQVLYDPPTGRPSTAPAAARPSSDGPLRARRSSVVYEVLETEPVIVIRPVTAYEPLPE